jgi:CDP-diacylglycerol--serine O-phosphatidyltransferase
MNKIRQNIPNAITCGNLLCGCLAIVKAFEGDLVWAAYLVGIAAVLDFFDGFAARMLRVTSSIGKDLDSLADMVTFGVVPGVVMFNLLIFSSVFYNHKLIEVIPNLDGRLPVSAYYNLFTSGDTILNFIPYVGFIIPVFSAIRLAIFNNDTRQTESFIGLPTPANAIFICSLPLIFFKQGSLDGSEFLRHLISPIVLVLMSCALSLLLIAPIPLFSLKFKFFGWQGNRMRYTFLILSVILIGLLKFMGIPLVIVLYVILSIVNNLFIKSHK